MRIQEWPNSGKRIIDELNGQDLSYDRSQYSGLITPASVVLEAGTSQRLHNDIPVVWDWFRQWRAIYRELLEGDDGTNEILQASEWGLDPTALEFQRESTRREEDPLLGRIDSVSLGVRQQIAEVQWKGGGEGFIAAIDATYRRLFPLEGGTESLGNLADNWGRVLRSANSQSEGPVHILNTGRNLWKEGEGFLAQELASQGVQWSFLPPEEVASHLRLQDGRVYLQIEGGLHPLDFIYLDRLSEVIPQEMMAELCRIALDGNIRIDPPSSYLFNQKIGLALPFMTEYKERFSDRIREILIPSVLVLGDEPDCTPIIPALSHSKRDLVGDLRTWDDLLKLPRSLREQLVFKCASTHQHDNHGGHGVWRLWGSESVAKRSLDEILNRARVQKEPWILQPYVNTTWDVPFVHPEKPEEVQRIQAHARFGIYCGHSEETPYLLGGIATFSPFWKVAGKTAGHDKDGKLTGSAFTDIRIE